MVGFGKQSCQEIDDVIFLLFHPGSSGFGQHVLVQFQDFFEDVTDASVVLLGFLNDDDVVFWKDIRVEKRAVMIIAVFLDTKNAVYAAGFQHVGIRYDFTFRYGQEDVFSSLGEADGCDVPAEIFDKVRRQVVRFGQFL